MKRFSKLLTLLILFSCSLAFGSLFSSDLELVADQSKYKTESIIHSRPFFLLTVPKSGTHLMTKLLVMLSNRKPDAIKKIVNQLPNIKFSEFENYVLRCWNKGFFPFQHSANFGQPFIVFSEKHPEFRKILMIRDLRDLAVSLTYHRESELDEELGFKADFDEKLTYILEGEINRSKDVLYAIENAVNLKDNQDFYVCRFEEFVGVKGGGSEERQRKAIVKLANYLGIALDQEYLDRIIKNLFGNNNGPKVSGNFRKGQIGSWENHFNEDHKALFRQKWNHLQTALGYPAL